MITTQPSLMYIVPDTTDKKTERIRLGCVGVDIQIILTPTSINDLYVISFSQSDKLFTTGAMLLDSAILFAADVFEREYNTKFGRQYEILH